MTWMQVRSKMRRIRVEIEESEEESGELNLIPYLDISTNVVMFLLATVTFSAALAHVPLDVPSVGSGGASKKQEDQGPLELRLAVAVSASGFIVTADDPIMIPPESGGKKIAKLANGDYDWPSLSKFLGQVKDAHPKEEKVLLALDPDLTYEVLVKSLDTTRTDGKRALFPVPALGVGQ